MALPETGSPDHTEPLQYDETQLSIASDFLAQLQLRSWFDGIFEKQAEPYMVRLLVGLFQAYRDGLLLTKKEAMTIMRAVDSRTSQRYIRLARDKGLLTISQSTHDQRVDFLCPTDELFALMKMEVSKFATEVRYVTAAIVEGSICESDPKIDPHKSPYRYTRHRTIQPISEPTQYLASEGDKRRARHIARLSETIRLAPKNIVAYRKRADEYESAGEKEKALADLSRMIELNPTDPDSWIKRAHFNRNRGANADALNDLTAFLGLAPDDADAYAERAHLYMFHKHDYAAAIADLSKAIECFPRSEDVSPFLTMEELLTTRAEAYERQGRLREAIADNRAVLALDDNAQYAKKKLDELERLSKGLGKNK